MSRQRSFQNKTPLPGRIAPVIRDGAHTSIPRNRGFMVISNISITIPAMTPPQIAAFQNEFFSRTANNRASHLIQGKPQSVEPPGILKPGVL